MYLLLALFQGDSGGPLHTADAKNITEVIGKKDSATQYIHKININTVLHKVFLNINLELKSIQNKHAFDLIEENCIPQLFFCVTVT